MLQSKIRRGELDREIFFIKKVISTGESNADHIDAWVKVECDPCVMARRRDVRGDVGVIAEQVSYSQRTVFTIDYREDIRPVENRLVHGGKVFEILAITDNESSRERYIDVMATLLNSETWTG